MTARASVRTKMLYVITKSNWGGAQRYVYDLATHLPRNQFDVCVALGGTGLGGAAAGALKERLDAAGIRTVFVQSFIRDISLLREWRALWELVALFKRERPDVVHLNSSKAGGLGSVAARIAGVRNIVFTIHGLPEDEPRSPLARFLIALFSYFTFILCHHIITITQDNYDRVRSRLGVARKTHLIHNGIDPTMALLSREEARLELTPPGVASDTIWIGSVGEMTRNKNYEMALRAIKNVQSKILYIIIGTGEDRGFLIDQVRKLDIADRVHFAGAIPNAARLLAAFDMFFLPSLKEGLPYVLLEAGGAALPVVASNVGGIPELITDGEGGLLIDPRDAQSAARALNTLAADAVLRKRLGNNLHAFVSNRFSVETMTEQTIAVYNAPRSSVSSRA